jgi:hypothetical protein
MMTATGAWKPDGTGVMNNGQSGGDDQLMDAHSARFVHTELPGRLFTIDFYAANRNWSSDLPVVFEVHLRAELMACGDVSYPGDTEEWSDYTYIDLPDTYATVEQADRAARLFALAYTADQIAWDGLTPWERGR